MNKKVTVNGKVYKMYQVPSTNWVFVSSPKSGRTYSIAKVVDGRIVEIDSEPAISDASNQELANAWLNS